ncbi:MAG: tetratricopeptide repeat protein [Luteolibacter sp.]
MIIDMTKCFPIGVAILVGTFAVVSCGNNDDRPILAGSAQGAGGEGEALYAKAKSLDEQGKRSSAIKSYKKVADRYSMAESAPKARFREAELLEEEGKTLKSFDAYQKFLTRYQGSGLYSKALDRQARMAQAAADGEVKNSFAGLKTKLATDKVAEMLGKVRDNAPRSQTAGKAQFTVGELYHSRKKPNEAIKAYRKLVRDQPESIYAADALFRVGVVLMEEADNGNRNQATLDLAAEAFNDYLIQYPGHAKNAEARRLLKEVESREVNRSLEVAEFYDKTGQTESAKVYYRDVLKQTKYGAAHDKAKARLKELGE